MYFHKHQYQSYATLESHQFAFWTLSSVACVWLKFDVVSLSVYPVNAQWYVVIRGLEHGRWVQSPRMCGWHWGERNELSQYYWTAVGLLGDGSFPSTSALPPRVQQRISGGLSILQATLISIANFPTHESGTRTTRDGNRAGRRCQGSAYRSFIAFWDAKRGRAKGIRKETWRPDLPDKAPADWSHIQPQHYQSSLGEPFSNTLLEEPFFSFLLP